MMTAMFAAPGNQLQVPQSTTYGSCLHGKVSVNAINATTCKLNKGEVQSGGTVSPPCEWTELLVFSQVTAFDGGMHK